MKKQVLLSVIALGLMNVSTISYAEDKPSQAISGKLSTLGAGVEYSRAINEKVNVRFGVYGGSTDDTVTESGVDYKADLDMQNIAAIADYHPWKSGFRVSGGLVYANNEVGLTAEAPDLEIDGTRYNAAIKGSIDNDGLAPYVGIGWDKATRKKHGWSFSADAGVLITGSPDVSLEKVRCVPAAACADFDTRLANEEASLKNDIDDAKYYPVIAIGVSRSF